MDKMRIIALTTLFVLLSFTLVTAGMYYLLTLVSTLGLRMIVIILVYSMLVAVPISYYLGHSEARGFLRGADKIMDSTLGKTIDAMEAREQVARKAREQQPMLTPGLRPRIVQFPPELRSARASPIEYTEDVEDDI